jgi:hypothetical protein
MAKARNPRGMPSPELLETCNTLHRSTRNLLIQIFPRLLPFSTAVAAHARGSSAETWQYASLTESAAAVISCSVGNLIWSKPVRPKSGDHENAC